MEVTFSLRIDQMISQITATPAKTIASPSTGHLDKLRTMVGTTTMLHHFADAHTLRDHNRDLLPNNQSP